MNNYEAKQGFKTFLLLCLFSFVGYAGIQGSRFGYKVFVRAGGSNNPPQEVRLLSLEKNTAVIAWKTEKESLGYISYGSSSGLGLTSTVEKNKSQTHIAVLPNLFPNTTYYYKIGVDQAVFGQSETEFFTFVTPAN